LRAVSLIPSSPASLGATIEVLNATEFGIVNRHAYSILRRICISSENCGRQPPKSCSASILCRRSNERTIEFEIVDRALEGRRKQFAKQVLDGCPEQP
jgi:hypothetical protein